MKGHQVNGVKTVALHAKSLGESDRLKAKETAVGYENAAFDNDTGCSIVAFKALGNYSVTLIFIYIHYRHT